MVLQVMSTCVFSGVFGDGVFGGFKIHIEVFL